MLNYSKFKNLSIDEIKSLWNKNKNPIGVYIHSPFCKSICKYCAYKGVLYSEKDYARYYSEYLPQRISEYSDIINRNKINSWFFGGGTPSLMNPKDMKNIFSKFPDKFKHEGEKTFEVHPAFWSKSQLDMMHQYDFDNIIIGVQTLNMSTLRNQNRIIYSYDDISSLVKEARIRDLNISFDLIAFLNERLSDIEILKNDLNLLSKLDPDQISIQSPFKRKSKYDHLVVQEVFKSSFKSSGEYTFLGDDSNIDKLINLFKFQKSLRFFKNKKYDDFINNNFLKFTYSLDENWSYPVGVPLSTLGIGSFRNKEKNTFSNINDNINYIEINENWVPKYYLIKNQDFFLEANKILNSLNQLGEPPKGIKIIMENNSIIEGEGLSEEPRGIRCSVNWDYSLSNMKHKEFSKKIQKSIDEYMKKVRDIFDNKL